MKLKLKIEGMHCNGCRISLENALNDDKHIISGSVSLEDKSATIETDDNIKYKNIENIVKKCGFKCISIEEVN